ncbi:hypothetical protein FRC08_000693 [Ceratobasidium sp. 394]|nr:hypothetical protein FRC08_000693 [Ceratobasidium sp. 394]
MLSSSLSVLLTLPNGKPSSTLAGSARTSSSKQSKPKKKRCRFWASLKATPSAHPIDEDTVINQPAAVSSAGREKDQPSPSVVSEKPAVAPRESHSADPTTGTTAVPKQHRPAIALSAPVPAPVSVSPSTEPEEVIPPSPKPQLLSQEESEGMHSGSVQTKKKRNMGFGPPQEDQHRAGFALSTAFAQAWRQYLFSARVSRSDSPDTYKPRPQPQVTPRHQGSTRPPPSALRPCPRAIQTPQRDIVRAGGRVPGTGIGGRSLLGPPWGADLDRELPRSPLLIAWRSVQEKKENPTKKQLFIHTLALRTILAFARTPARVPGSPMSSPRERAEPPPTQLALSRPSLPGSTPPIALPQDPAFEYGTSHSRNHSGAWALTPERLCEP